MRLSRAGLRELVLGVEKLPFIRAITLKNNGINEIHEKEVLEIMSL